jgi:hypothetical protein
MQQVFRAAGSIAVSFTLAALAWGLFFEALNMVLALGNLSTCINTMDRKAALLISLRLVGGPRPPIEWSFTISRVGRVAAACLCPLWLLKANDKLQRCCRNWQAGYLGVTVSLPKLSE